MKQTDKLWIASWIGSSGRALTTLFSTKPVGTDMVVHGSVDVEYDVPEADELNPLLIQTLREKQTHIKAMACAECVEIEGQIQSLLAIGHEVAA